jgi:hypothetical protein
MGGRAAETSPPLRAAQSLEGGKLKSVAGAKQTRQVERVAFAARLAASVETL